MPGAHRGGLEGTQLTDRFVIVDPATAAALLSGRKSQMRVLPGSPLSVAGEGDRLCIREACIAGRYEGGKVYSTRLARAEFMIFADGWRQHRDGSFVKGRPPTDPDHEWLPAVHMPRWASRASLIVEWVRSEQLQHISRRDIRAEGALPLLGGLLWRWPKPMPGLHTSPHRMFARYWNVNNSAAGQRWEDDPVVHVIGFRVEPRSAKPSPQASSQL
jgi:hypothetical protein